MGFQSNLVYQFKFLAFLSHSSTQKQLIMQNNFTLLYSWDFLPQINCTMNLRCAFWCQKASALFLVIMGNWGDYRRCLFGKLIVFYALIYNCKKKTLIVCGFGGEFRHIAHDALDFVKLKITSHFASYNFYSNSIYIRLFV